MRFTVLIVALGLLTAVYGESVSQMPKSEYADSEVTTNIPVSIDFGLMSRMVFEVSLEYSPTNSLEVSIGTDRDEDGSLSIDEFVHTFGFDCGRWFSRSAMDDTLTTFESDGAGRITHTFLLKKRKLDTDWNLIRVTRRGTGEVLEFAMAEGRKPGAALMVR